MVATNFEGLVGYRTLRDEGQAPLKVYDCVVGRDFQVATRGKYKLFIRVPLTL